LFAIIIGFLIYDNNHSTINKSQETKDSLGKQTIIIKGDNVEGDKIGGDKVNGDKVNGDKIIKKK
jgi:hypothetical protein